MINKSMLNKLYEIESISFGEIKKKKKRRVIKKKYLQVFKSVIL